MPDKKQRVRDLMRSDSDASQEAARTPTPVLPSEAPHCGYFTGDTTPPGCKALMERYRAAIRVSTAAQNLCHFMAKSLDVGPQQSANPRHESWHWQTLRGALTEFNKLASEAHK